MLRRQYEHRRCLGREEMRTSLGGLLRVFASQKGGECQQAIYSWHINIGVRLN